jgi:hypothetical protein
MTHDRCCNYFNDKFSVWDSTATHFNPSTYVNNQGKDGLIQEFRRDRFFKEIVCPHLAQYAQDKENEVTSILNDAQSLSGGNLLPVAIDLLVAAVLEACGDEKDASNLVKIAIVTAALSAATVLLYSALPFLRKKKRRKL